MTSPSSATEDLFYGTDESQRVFVTWPDSGLQPRGVVALIHGGYWRSRFDAALMDPLAASLRQNGWITANIEYRRGHTGPWPAPLDDVREALAEIANDKSAKSVGGPLISIGHSVGGQLALLTSAIVDGVVALAPVTDVERTYREHLGDNAASEYFGTSPEMAPETYRDASPIQQPTGKTATLIVHGINDDRVPVSHSRDFMAYAISQAMPAELVEYANLSHLDDINSQAVHWPGVLSWLATVSASEPHNSESS